MKRTLTLMFLCACAPTPVVTGGGTTPDGAAWFAVTEGKELTFYRCEPSGCASVPRANAGASSADGAPRPEPEPEPAAEEPAPADEPGDAEEAGGAEEPGDESGPPDEERMDLMEGVF